MSEIAVSAAELSSNSRGPKFQKKKHQRLRVFQNDILEKFTVVHPIIPLVMWTPVMAYCIYHAAAVDGLNVFQIVGTMLAALLAWTFAEYTLHRWVFHIAPTSAFRKRLQFIIHGLHHDDPNDAGRLVMPPFPALVLAAIFVPLFYWLVGPVYVYPFVAGFLVGYLGYDYTHYATHHFTPRTRWGRYVKQYHMLHHFTDHEAKWGVSNPLWDYVFRTVGKPLAFPKRK